MWRRALIVALILVSACSASSNSPPARSGSPSPSPAPERPLYCQRFFCRSVHHADLDGDGQPDRIVVLSTTRGRALSRRTSGDEYLGRYRVQVTLTSGSTLSFREVATAWMGSGGAGPDPFYGAAQIDGLPGRELFLGHNAGAHELDFHVLTWRAPSLVALPPPPALGGLWYLNSSAGTGEQGFTCVGGRFFTYEWVPTFRHGHVGGHGVDVAYRWSDGRWVAVQRYKYSAQDRSYVSRHHAGCAGLPPGF